MKHLRKKDLPKVDPVRIKPLFGLRPGLWLTIAYALALVLLVFFIAFLPDILDGHKRVTFTSDAGTVAVYIDGIYEGGTPFTRKIESGTHDVSYRLNGYEIDSFTIKVGHPVFLNWLFPRTQKVNSQAGISEDAYKSITAVLLEDSNLYGAILSYDYTHPYSDFMQTYARAVAASSLSFRDTASADKALQTALLFVTTEQMASDAGSALAMLGINLVQPYEVLSGTQGGKVGTADQSRPQVKATASKLDTSYFTLEGFRIDEATFSNGRVTDASYPECMEAGKTVSTQAFNIGAYCITEYQYNQFISACPEWAAENKANLIAEGLVDDYYLDGVTLSSAIMTNRPVRNISWYAAQAFCQWLGSITGKNVYLPTEDQWIAACLSTDQSYQKSLMPAKATSAPSSMLGSVWEMTGSAFIPLARVASDDMVETAKEVLELFGTQTDMVVKGGSYVNKSTDIDIYSVGTTYRSLCSDFMGFRVAWD